MASPLLMALQDLHRRATFLLLKNSPTHFGAQPPRNYVEISRWRDLGTACKHSRAPAMLAIRSLPRFEGASRRMIRARKAGATKPARHLPKEHDVTRGTHRAPR